MFREAGTAPTPINFIIKLLYGTGMRLMEAIRAQLVLRREWHEQDLPLNKVDVWLPDALAVKYPNASKEWGWLYVFAAKNYSINPRSKTERRHHVEEKQVQRYVLKAALAVGIAKPTTPHTLRIHLRRIYCKAATIFARFRSCWGIRSQYDDDLYPCTK